MASEVPVVGLMLSLGLGVLLFLAFMQLLYTLIEAISKVARSLIEKGRDLKLEW